jgi:predicted metalloprotease with PDZ domain
MKVRLVAVCALFGLAVASAPAPQPHAWPWYGMYIRPIRDAVGRRVLHVENVAKDGPAARAGIRVEDLVTSIGSLPVDFGDEYELLSWLSRQKPGTRLPIALMRAGRVMTVVLDVGTLPDSARGSWERTVSAALRARTMRREVPPRP